LYLDIITKDILTQFNKLGAMNMNSKKIVSQLQTAFRFATIRGFNVLIWIIRLCCIWVPNEKIRQGVESLRTNL